MKRERHEPVFEEAGNRLIIRTSAALLGLNRKRGFAIDKLIFKNISDQSLVGTLPQGYYENISLGVDFYSGHTIIEIPGKQKITDLDEVNHFEKRSDNPDYVSVVMTVKTRAGTVKKSIKVFKKINRVDIEYKLDLANVFPAAIRSAIMTLNPEAFDLKSLYYECRNGGKVEERFFLKDAGSINHPALSLSVSSSGALGNTDGCFKIGDKEKTLTFVTPMVKTALLPMINYKSGNAIDPYFLRILYSLQEFDDTSFLRVDNKRKFDFSISIFGASANE